MKGLIIFIIAVIILGAIGSCGSDTTTSYYYDSNNNGQMDRGEHVYDEDSDGDIHLDYDGDGWWDT